MVIILIGFTNKFTLWCMQKEMICSHIITIITIIIVVIFTIIIVVILLLGLLFLSYS
jgi:hypothetical protein